MKKILKKIRQKLCRHNYKPKTYTLLDDCIVCNDLCSKCEKVKSTEYNVDQKEYIESLGYERDILASVWAKTLRRSINTITSMKEMLKKLDETPANQVEGIRIVNVSRPSIKVYSKEEDEQ